LTGSFIKAFIHTKQRAKPSSSNHTQAAQ